MWQVYMQSTKGNDNLSEENKLLKNKKMTPLMKLEKISGIVSSHPYKQPTYPYPFPNS